MLGKLNKGMAKVASLEQINCMHQELEVGMAWERGYLSKLITTLDMYYVYCVST